MHHPSEHTKGTTMTEQNTPTPGETLEPAKPLQGEASGFAAFNKTLGVFVGGVHRGDSARADAGRSRQAKAAKDAGHDVEVRPV
jgi:hypothetical protein